MVHADFEPKVQNLNIRDNTLDLDFNLWEVSLLKYFERVSQEDGLNTLKENPCKLLDFQKLILRDKSSYKGNTGNREYLVVILSGQCNLKVDEKVFSQIGGRPDVFAGKPWSVYIPIQSNFEISKAAAGSPVEVALCSALAEAKYEPFLVSPEEVVAGKWGISNFARDFHLILGSTSHPVNRLIVGETFTPSGNWSTYPPHRHEVNRPPEEVFMEEMYYFKVTPPDGFSLTKLYTDDGEIDDVYTVKDETILKISRGYHTVVSAPGYVTYYLWFLAGNTREQHPFFDPDVGWVNKTVNVIKNIRDNLSF